MEARKQTPNHTAPKTAKGAPFCLRLNTLRALSAACVILAHVTPFLNVYLQFYSLHISGHDAVYFFFALSGYLLTLSFIKEIKRRLSDDKKKSKSSKATEEEAQENTHSQPPPQIDIDLGREGKKLKEKNGEAKPASQTECSSSSPLPEITVISGTETKKEKKLEGFWTTWFKAVQQSPLLCMLCRFLWNRAWRLFPLYYACSCFLKFSSIQGHDYHPGPMPDWTWEDIFLMRKFPNHLWTMRIESLYSYMILPVYICALYGAFKLQKNGHEKSASYAFAAIVAICLFVAIFCMLAADRIEIPWQHHDKFYWNLPPFFFGMLFGLFNYKLELEYNKRQQAAKAKADKKDTEETSVTKDQKPKASLIRRLGKYTLSILYQNRYSIIFYAVLIRIAFVNPGFSAFYTHNDDINSYWYAMNRQCYWHALFVLINDSRGGFYKFMHDKPDPKPTTLHPTDFHRLVYYYGLWSYTIYLIHPLVFVRLGLYVGGRSWTVEFVVLSVALCLPLAGIIDFLIDKMLVNKIILGTIIPILGRIFVAKKAVPALIPEVEKAPYSKL